MFTSQVKGAILEDSGMKYIKSKKDYMYI